MCPHCLLAGAAAAVAMIPLVPVIRAKLKSRKTKKEG